MANTSVDTDTTRDPFRSARLESSLTKRRNIFESRLLLLYAALTTRLPGRTLSIGCGTGAFEQELRRRYGLAVDHALEPSPNLAATARRRGLDVELITAQQARYEPDSYDTIYYHGSSFGFIPEDELEDTFRRNEQALRPGGRIVLTDVPKESALGILLLTLQKFPVDLDIYRDLVQGTSFFDISDHHYKPNWRTIPHYADLLRRVGFATVSFKQTVLANPPYQNDAVEQPVEGYTQGNYVAIIAQKADGEH